MSTIVSQDGWTRYASEQKRSGQSLALLFVSDWHKPCQQMIDIWTELASDFPNVSFAMVDAEKVPQLALKHAVESVPVAIMLHDGAPIARVEGVDVPRCVELVGDLAAKIPSVAEVPSINDRLQKLINLRRVMVFIKGTPQQPRCGFSKQIIALLNDQPNCQYGYFDILSDDAVRQGLKEFANWQTFPQVWINGQFIGGLDVVKELIEEGEFEELNVSAGEPVPSSATTLEQRLTKLINSERVMLFMKGSPEQPRCGFSQAIIRILNDQHCKFGSFDILSDEDVRSGLKTMSNWPTYPQLYVNGSLLGGLDIVKELLEDDELADALAA